MELSSRDSKQNGGAWVGVWQAVCPILHVHNASSFYCMPSLFLVPPPIHFLPSRLHFLPAVHAMQHPMLVLPLRGMIWLSRRPSFDPLSTNPSHFCMLTLPLLRTWPPAPYCRPGVPSFGHLDGTAHMLHPAFIFACPFHEQKVMWVLQVDKIWRCDFVPIGTGAPLPHTSVLHF